MTGHISAFPHTWDSRFKDIPRFPATPIIGRYDGDMAELAEMIDRIIDAGPARLTPAPPNRIYLDTIADTGICPHRLPDIVDTTQPALDAWWEQRKAQPW